MPGMYRLRSSSSSSSSSSFKPPFPARQRPGLPSASVHGPAAPLPPPTASPAIPAYLKSSDGARMPVIPVTSAQPILSKQGIDPLGEAPLEHHERTSALNYSSSGSSHDPSTVCLAAMVHEFLEEEVAVGSCGRSRCNCLNGVCREENCISVHEPEEPHMPDEQLCEILEGITSCTSKQELLLLVDVGRATEAETEELIGGDHDAAVTERLRRPVMKRLRQEGYNAAICKSRWKHSDGLPAGDYEYIDVLVDDKASGSKNQERYIVDLDFKSQFEIARASRQYTQLLAVLPRLYVGRPERLKQILKIMANAAKHSLKEQNLLLPPWRKHKYMQAKWFSSYRRTTKTAPAQRQRSVLGVGFRAPTFTALALDFTQEMDLLFYKAQVRGMNNFPQRLCYDQHDTKRDPLPAHPPGGVTIVCGENMGNYGVPLPGLASKVQGGEYCYLPVRHDMCSVVVCTDWQLPAVDDVKLRSNRGAGASGGISTALKKAEASLMWPHEQSVLGLANMVAVGSS